MTSRSMAMGNSSAWAAQPLVAGAGTQWLGVRDGDLDVDVWKVERVGDDLDGAFQTVDRIGAWQRRKRLEQRRHRRCTSVDHHVGEALEAATQRLEQHCHTDRTGEGQRLLPARREPAASNDERDVHDRDRHGEPAVDDDS